MPSRQSPARPVSGGPSARSETMSKWIQMPSKLAGDRRLTSADKLAWCAMRKWSTATGRGHHLMKLGNILAETGVRSDHWKRHVDRLAACGHISTSDREGYQYEVKGVVDYDPERGGRAARHRTLRCSNGLSNRYFRRVSENRQRLQLPVFRKKPSSFPFYRITALAGFRQKLYSIFLRKSWQTSVFDGPAGLFLSRLPPSRPPLPAVPPLEKCRLVGQRNCVGHRGKMSQEVLPYGKLY